MFGSHGTSVAATSPCSGRGSTSGGWRRRTCRWCASGPMATQACLRPGAQSRGARHGGSAGPIEMPVRTEMNARTFKFGGRQPPRIALTVGDRKNGSSRVRTIASSCPVSFAAASAAIAKVWTSATSPAASPSSSTSPPTGLLTGPPKGRAHDPPRAGPHSPEPGRAPRRTPVTPSSPRSPGRASASPRSRIS